MKRCGLGKGEEITSFLSKELTEKQRREMEKMTVKELAVVAGVSIATLRRTAKNLFPDSMRIGKTAVFSKDQCFDIMQKVRKKNLVHQPMQNAQVPMQNAEVISQAVVAAMQAVMMPMMEKMMTVQKALPAPMKEDCYSLVGYCKVNGITVNRSELAMHGSKLKKIANQKDIKISKIPDVRWGFVNSYPVEILDEYFAA